MAVENVVCAVCTQDWVKPARIKGSSISFWLCFECESVWLSSEWIDSRSSEYLGDFMATHGYDDSFSNIDTGDPEESAPDEPDATRQ